MKIMQGKTDLDGAIFTPGEAARVAEIPEKLFSVWLARNIVRPARIGKEKTPGKRLRGQRLFSIKTIFEAKMTFQLVSHLAITASEANKIAQQAMALDWMHSIVRHHPKTLPFVLKANREKDCWTVQVDWAEHDMEIATTSTVEPAGRGTRCRICSQ